MKISSAQTLSRNLGLALGLAVLALPLGAAPPRPPSVVVIITDDQGHGDLGFHGNPRIRTPHLDALARRSARFSRFYVSPVCSPTRASLLTGRYNYRTGVVDTFIGRSLMDPREVTLAEMLADAGYRTGIFGKWHLGDNHPLRPRDQGFHESLVLKGGGLGQPSDLPGGSSYFDPVLLEDGRPVRARGHVSDAITERALRFVEANRERPFLAYLAFNAPHAPLEVPEHYLAMYRDDVPDAVARVYGMVTNIDDNVGRLLAKLEALDLAESTIVVFLTDNGPDGARYTSDLRGRKATVYEGGIRVPCFVRWPGQFPARDIEPIAAHIDIVPTILEACGVRPPADVKIDGLSLLPLLRSEQVEWPDRTLYLQWHRGDRPEPLRHFAAVTQRWKLVQPVGAGAGEMKEPPRFELYDLQSDPSERSDLAKEHPGVADALRRGHLAWFEDVSSTRGFDPPRIGLGSERENPVVLTRQDWRGPRAGWRPDDLGHWEVEVAAEGSHGFTLHFDAGGPATVRVALGQVVLEKEVPAGETRAVLGPVRIPAGPARLEASLVSGAASRGVRYLEVQREDAPAPTAPGRPSPGHSNVVLILADDLGWGDLACYGHPRFKTPHIDAMAASGARLTSFYAPVPFCAPSRAAILTGRHPFRSGMTGNPVPAGDPVTKDMDHIGLSPEETTLADLLKAAGYRTALFGKWHLGHQPRFRPLERGFEEYLGILYSNDMHPVELVDGNQVAEYPVVQATLARRLTRRALSFLERNRDRPFFLLFAPPAPHKPLAVSEEFDGKSGAGLYGDAVAELDACVGDVLAKLEDLDLERNTLVVFASDNGPWYGGSTGGLRGMKGQGWEGGIRVPCIARWPGRIPAGHVSAEPAMLCDLFATALAAAGAAAPAGRVIDGRDILPLLASGAPSPHEAVYSFRGDRVATVRSGRWKLHLVPPGPARERSWEPGEPWIDPRRPDGIRILAPPGQAHPSEYPGARGGDPVNGPALFDLEDDPAESRNVAAHHRDVVERLKALADGLPRN